MPVLEKKIYYKSARRNFQNSTDKIEVSYLCYLWSKFQLIPPKGVAEPPRLQICSLAKYALGLAYILTFRAQRVFLRAEYNMK
jgi:hypothetical protein